MGLNHFHARTGDFWAGREGEPSFSKLLGVVARRASAMEAVNFFQHPALLGKAVVDVSFHHASIPGAMPSSRIRLRDAYGGPVPRDLTVIPKPDCSYLSLLHMVVTRRSPIYSEELVKILLRNPALTTTRDLNLRSDIPVTKICEQQWQEGDLDQVNNVNRSGKEEGKRAVTLQDRKSPFDLNPLPILLTSVLLGPSRYGAVLEILERPDLSRNHLNYFLPLWVGSGDNGKQGHNSSAASMPHRYAAIYFAHSDSDFEHRCIKATAFAVEDIIEKGEQFLQDGWKLGGRPVASEMTLEGAMAPRLRAALEMGGCTALSLLLAVVDGVDKEVRLRSLWPFSDAKQIFLFLVGAFCLAGVVSCGARMLRSFVKCWNM